MNLKTFLKTVPIAAKKKIKRNLHSDDDNDANSSVGSTRVVRKSQSVSRKNSKSFLNSRKTLHRSQAKRLNPQNVISLQALQITNNGIHNTSLISCNEGSSNKIKGPIICSIVGRDYIPNDQDSPYMLEIALEEVGNCSKRTLVSKYRVIRLEQPNLAKKFTDIHTVLYNIKLQILYCLFIFLFYDLVKLSVIFPSLFNSSRYSIANFDSLFMELFLNFFIAVLL